jgi:hypothetical protein
MTTIKERDNKRLRCVENALPKRTHEVRNRLQNDLVHLGSLLYLSLSSKLRLDSAPATHKETIGGHICRCDRYCGVAITPKTIQNCEHSGG